jgi:thiol-disulfide isomerase/thioredoxin
MNMNRAERRRRGRSASLSLPYQRLAAVGMTVIAVAVIAAIAVVNRKSVPQSASEAPIYAPLSVGMTAPPFAVTAIEGQRFDSAQMNGPILLEVFATWCPHCQHETATLNTLQRRLHKELSIVAVSGSDTSADRSSPETLDDVRSFARYFGVIYPIAYDPGLSVAKHYLQGGFPTIVFIDRAKRITAIESGEIPLRRLAADAQRAGA